jgi:hypothetical protein
MSSTKLVGRHSFFRAASGELTEQEIAALYGGVMAEAEASFAADPSYLVDIASSGAQVASRRGRRASVV